MSKLGARNSELYIPVTPRRYTSASNQQKTPVAEAEPSTCRNTRSMYTITSSVTRDRRKNHLAESPRTVTAVTPHTTTTSAPLPTPPRSVMSTSTAIPVSTPDSKIYPEANTIHHYTKCAHTSPPATRPLNVQPTVIYSPPDGDAQKSTLLARCYDCDLAHRRKQETSVLQRNHKASNALYLRLLATRAALQHAEMNSQVDEEGIKNIVAEIDSLVARREADVKSIWKGFSARWGPGTVGFQQGLQSGGRMDVKWERPEKPVR